MEIVPVEAQHYPAVSRIYAEGIATGMATFQTEAPSWEAWDKSHLPIGRIALFDKDTLTGWAALSPVSARPVYAGVAEVSIYISAGHRGRGIGKVLLLHLIAVSEQHGFWTLQSGIFPENGASIHLHLQCGFRQIGYREKIGCLHGQWRDNILMERRSKRVGV